MLLRQTNIDLGWREQGARKGDKGGIWLRGRKREGLDLRWRARKGDLPGYSFL